MIHFYGSAMSSSGRSHWMLEEVGVPYEYHRVALRDPESVAELRKVNPGGKIPFLIDGDFRMSESIAINFYLAEKYAPAMWSVDPIERARMYEWSLWGITNLMPKALEVMFAAMHPQNTTPEKIESAKKVCQGLIDHLETRIENFVVGGRFTVADVNLGSNVNLALRAQAATPGPKTLAWMEAMRARPAYDRSVKAA